MEIIKDLNLIIEYNAGGNRRKDAIAKIRAALKADPAFFERPDIIAEIKQSIKDSGYNRDVPITKWGDSLSDWVDFYGWLPYSNFDYGVLGPVKIGFVGGMDSAQSWANWRNLSFPYAGDFGNSPILLDSWADYYTYNTVFQFGSFKVQNYGMAGDTTGHLLDKIQVKLANADNYWERQVSDLSAACVNEQIAGNMAGIGDAPEFMKDPSSLVSVAMIGGNNMMNNLFAAKMWLPYAGKYEVEKTLEDITIFTDWNIENGKKVLLEGTMPAYSIPLREPYRTDIVNRKTVCSPIEDILIMPEDLPWWVCAFSASACRQVQDAFTKGNIEIIKAFGEFQRIVWNGPSGKTGFEIGETEFDKSKEKSLTTKVFRLLSMNQACLNDRIAKDIGPAYKAAYPDQADYFGMYDFMQMIPGDNFFNGWWVPFLGSYQKMYDADGTQPKDPIHYGPKGYKRWATLIGTKLGTLKWNLPFSSQTVPEPDIAINLEGAGSIINKKAKATNLFGKELGKVTKWVDPNSPKREIWYKDYKNNNRIYVPVVNPNSSGASRYGDAYLTAGGVFVKYKEKENGKSAHEKPMGFPTTDTLCWGLGIFCNLNTTFFECGHITHDTVPLGATWAEMPGICGEQPSADKWADDPDFDVPNLDSRWFAFNIFHFIPKSGKPPFVWHRCSAVKDTGGNITDYDCSIYSKDLPDGYELESNGRLKGGPTNNANGQWTFYVRVTDSQGRKSPVKEAVMRTGL